MEHTRSERGRKILDQWEITLPRFAKVMPRDYRKMINAFKRVEERGLSGDEAELTAFREAMAAT